MDIIPANANAIIKGGKATMRKVVNVIIQNSQRQEKTNH